MTLSGAETTDELARLAREGDSEARNALWTRVAFAVEAALARQRSLPRLWDREDLRQEAFLVFAEVCTRWREGPFDVYFEREYQPELTRHVRRIRRRQERESSAPIEIEQGADPDAAAMYRLAELLESLSRLPAPVELALRLHLLWGLPLAEVGRQLGLGRRAVGGLLPLARKVAAGAVESEEERLERLVRELYAFADSTGRLRGASREVRSRLGLSPREYAAFLDTLQAHGVLTGRVRGHAGRLPAAGPEVALRLLHRRDDLRTA